MMKKIFIIIILALITSISGYSQNVNSYKYVIVPNQFEFLKGADQYQLNSLTKFLFEKYGFEAYIEGEKLPADLANNRCKGLTAFVNEDSGLFTTKLIVGLKDCNNQQLFLSEEGVSRTKEFKQAYHEALREAFRSIDALNYQYDDSKAEIAEIKKEEPLKTKAEVTTPVAVAEVVAVPAVGNKQKSEMKVEEKVTSETPSEPKKKEMVSKTSEMSFANNGAMFYLKKSDKGYNFFQDGMAEPFAALIASNKENNFIYSSITNQGVAYFQENGDLIVEILDRSTNSTNIKTYTLKD